MLKRICSSLIILSLLLTWVSPAFGEEDSRVQRCKLEQVDKSQVLRIGWPKYPGLINTNEDAELLVVGVDFSDAPTAKDNPRMLSDNLELDSVTEYFKHISGGKFNLTFDLFPRWVRMPKSSLEYGDDPITAKWLRGEWSTHLLAHDLYKEIAKSIGKRDYAGVIIFVSGGHSLSGNTAYAVNFDSELAQQDGNFDTYIVFGSGILDSKVADPWKVISHEINHLIGLPDLYSYEPDSYWKMKSTAPFGLQSYVFDLSSDGLGWNKWINGWLDDSKVHCIEKSLDLIEVNLSSEVKGSSVAKNFAVLPLSNSRALVIEALEEKGFDARTYPNSVLVYLVDASLNSGNSPIKLIPRKTQLTMAPLSPYLPDWERFREAPLIPNSYLTFEDLLIVNTLGSNAITKVQIYSGELAKSTLAELSKNPDFSNLSEVTSTTQTSLKTIICVKSNKTKKISGVNPKCPKGYKKTKS